ncbi:MAG: 30S ribosomal protein S30e [Candidatus Nezhaarchaeales archaeon]
MPSHGSLTKAGKVRSQTPKIPAKPRTRPFPRAGFRSKYVRRVLRPSLKQEAPSPA